MYFNDAVQLILRNNLQVPQNVQKNERKENTYTHTHTLKEELHNRFNLISEERVKIFKHNSENMMKFGWKIRKLWHFEVSQIFKKHFLTSQYEYMQMSEVMMSSPHNFPFILYTEMTKI